MGIYSQMQNWEFQHPSYQMFTTPDFGFYQLMPNEGIDTNSMGQYKFHMTIHPDDVSQAWDIVAQELMNSPYPQVAKVTKPETTAKFANPDSIQAGKMITVYTRDNVPPEFYKDLMQRLENRLDQAGIRSGPLSNADRIIPGGKYSSYRAESGPNGEYMASADMTGISRDQRHNPWNQPDPFDDMQMQTRTPRPSVAPSQNQSPLFPRELLADMQDRLGADNITAIRELENGDVQVRVPLGFSRSNFEDVGIDNPKGKLSLQNYDGFAVITIPEEEVQTIVDASVASAARALVNPAISDIGKWQMAQTEGGGIVARIAVGEMGREGAEALFDELKELGLNPIAHQSATLGPTIRLAGEDVGKLAQIQSDIAAGVDVKANIDAPAPDAPKGLLSGAADWLSNLGKRSGMIGGAVIGTVATGVAVVGGASTAEAGEMFYKTAVPYGETQIDVVIDKDMEAASKSATVETVSTVASIGGLAAGAAAGAAIGSVVPVVGTVIGGIVGGVIGSIGAGVGAGYATEAAIEVTEEKGWWQRINPFSSSDDENTQVASSEQTPEPDAQLSPNGVDLEDIDIASVKPVDMPTFEANEPVEVAFDIDGDGVDEVFTYDPDNIDPGFVVEAPESTTIAMDLDGDGIDEIFEVKPVDMPTFGDSDDASYSGDTTLLAEVAGNGEMQIAAALTMESETIIHQSPTLSSPQLG